jgi:ABC-type lipoprotein release transport system permease subunit
MRSVAFLFRSWLKQRWRAALGLTLLLGLIGGVALTAADGARRTATAYPPLALCAVLALLAVGTFTHLLVTSVRRRRRELAILKTLGLRRAQLLRVVGWEATALAAAAMVAGLPLGLLAGRWSWALFAGALGVAGGADVPVLLVLLAIPVTWLLAILIAAWPARAAARVRPAAVLRAE